MHLVKAIEDRNSSQFYHRAKVLTRPYSLPYVFRKLRVHRNLTKHALAEKFSVSEGYVISVENGSRFPSLRYCLKCAELYGANPYWVKSKWSQEAIARFSSRLLRRLGLDR